MMVFRTLGTVLIGLSYFSGILKNLSMFSDTKLKYFLGVSLWSITWRTFIIIFLWII